MAAEKRIAHDLKYDIYTMQKGEKVLDAFPALADYPELVKHGSNENDALLRYCILLTDKGSGFLKTANIELRHERAWAEVGLAADDPRKAGAFDFTDEGVAAMSYALLEDADSMMLAWVLAGEAMLWQDIKKMRSPVTPSEAAEAVSAKAGKDKKPATGSSNQGGDKKSAYDLRGDFFDKIPDRIRVLADEKRILFHGDKALEDSSKVTAKQRTGVAEAMSREYSKGR